MYHKHHENRRQNALKLFGMKHTHKNYGGVMDASDGCRVRKNYGGVMDDSEGQKISDANQMLRESAANLGLKRGGHTHKPRHHKMAKHDSHSMKGFDRLQTGSHGSDRKIRGISSRKPMSNAHEMGMKAMSRDHFDFGRERSKDERRSRFKEEHREKFAIGGVGKIRLKQMTLTGKPIPAPGHKGHRNAREVY